MSQKKWCMKAGMAAGSLACRLELMREYLMWPDRRHRSTVREEAATITRDARALKRVVGRKVPEAAELERATKELAKALIPKKAIAIDEALADARKAMTKAQLKLRNVYQTAARFNCQGGTSPTPEVIDSPVRVAYIQATQQLGNRRGRKTR